MCWDFQKYHVQSPERSPCLLENDVDSVKKGVYLLFALQSPSRPSKHRSGCRTHVSASVHSQVTTSITSSSMFKHVQAIELPCPPASSVPRPGGTPCRSDGVGGSPQGAARGGGLLGNKKLLVAKGIATRSKDATRGSWPYY